MKKKFNKKILILLVFTLFIASFVGASANFFVNYFECTPSEVSIGDDFSCSAQVENNGDEAGSVAVATLYPDENEWMEEANYAQAFDTSTEPGQSNQVTFTGLRAIKSGIFSFSKIMLDDVTDTYPVDNEIKENVVDILINVNNSDTSVAASETFTSQTEVTASGNVEVTLSFDVVSGTCDIGEQENPQVFEMADQSVESRTWTVTQGADGDCVYTISASAIEGVALATDEMESTVECSDCSTESLLDVINSILGGGGGGSGIGTTVITTGEITTTAYTAELSSGENMQFNFSEVKHFLSVINLTETTAQIIIESNPQLFTLNLGEMRNIDLTGDELAEISVKLTSINVLTNKATFVITRLTEPTPADKSEKIAIDYYIKNFVPKYLIIIGIIFIIILIIVLFFLIRWIIRKKIKNKLKKYKINRIVNRINLKKEKKKKKYAKQVNLEEDNPETS